MIENARKQKKKMANVQEGINFSLPEKLIKLS